LLYALTINCDKYGGLYQWAEAIQYKNGVTNSIFPNPSFSGNMKGICPSGWLIPSNAEFQTLATAVNNDVNALLLTGQGSGTNTSGFSALFPGHRGNGSGFIGLGHESDIWSSTEDGASF